MKLTKTTYVALAVIAGAILSLAAYALFRSGAFGAVAGSAMTLIAVLLAAMTALIVSPGRATLRPMPEQGGTGARNSPAVAAVLLGFVVAGYLLVVGLVLIWIGTGDRPTVAVGPLLILGAVAVTGIPGVVALVRGRLQLGGLLLTPDAVTYASYRSERSISWDQIIDIRFPASSLGIAIIGREGDVMSIPHGLLRIDPTALSSLLACYKDHPRARPELADDRAASRAGAGTGVVPS